MKETGGDQRQSGCNMENKSPSELYLAEILQQWIWSAVD